MTLEKWMDALKNGYGVASPGEWEVIQLLNQACRRLEAAEAVCEWALQGDRRVGTGIVAVRAWRDAKGDKT